MLHPNVNARDSMEWDLLDNDELVNPDALKEEQAFEKICNLADCSQMPAKNLMKIKVKISSQTEVFFWYIYSIRCLFTDWL